MLTAYSSIHLRVGPLKRDVSLSNWLSLSIQQAAESSEVPDLEFKEWMQHQSAGEVETKVMIKFVST